MNKSVCISTPGKGLIDITRDIQEATAASGVSEGLVTIFVQHTSASLVIQENADPAVLNDLEDWLDRAVPESLAYEHQEEGPDDMPAHIKGAITATHLAIPLVEGSLALGVWQGIFLWEHRNVGRERNLVVHVAGTNSGST